MIGAGSRFDAAVAAFDAVNAEDPNRAVDDSRPRNGSGGQEVRLGSRAPASRRARGGRPRAPGGAHINTFERITIIFSICMSCMVW